MVVMVVMVVMFDNHRYGTCRAGNAGYARERHFVVPGKAACLTIRIRMGMGWDGNQNYHGSSRCHTTRSH